MGQKEFRAEVKPCELAATLGRDRTKHVQVFMKKAIVDIQRCIPDGTRRLAIVFGTPYLTRRLRAEVKNRVDWLSDQALSIKAEIGADAVAWTFPVLLRPPSFRDSICPGVIVWIEEVRR